MSQSSQSDKMVRNAIISRTPTPTPTKTLYPGKNVPVPSLSSGQNSSSIRAGGLGPSSKHWNTRMADDNIPSDDSDPGDKSPFGAKPRTRIRKRRATRTGPVPGGLPSWISHRSVSAGSIIPPPNPGISHDNANSNTEKQSGCVKALFSQPVNDTNNGAKQARSVTNLGNAASSSYDSLQTSADLRSRQDKRKKSLTSKALTSDTNQRPGSIVARQNSRHEISRNHLSEEWIFYSVWFPSWDIIWKCHNGKIPLKRNKYFCKLLKKIIFDNTGPDLHGTYDLNVMKVQIVGNDTNDYKTVGVLQTLPPRANKKIDWKPFPPMGKLIEVATSRGDFIVQCTPKNPPASISKRKTCIVHLTPKDGSKVDFYGLFNSDDVHLAIYNIEYEHYFPRIVKCSPYFGNSVNLKEGEQRQLPAASLVTNRGTLAVENILPLPTRSPDVQVGHSNLIADNAGTANDEIEAVFDNVSINSSPEDVQIIGHNVEEESNSDHTGSGGTNNLSQNIQSGSDEFNVEHFLLNGTFVPGPLRPKVKRSSGDAYKYDTLFDLRVTLRATIRQDIRSGVVPNMMIKDMRHTYGLVVELVPQSRHKNAYYVRISDETRKSVLLRIHSDTKDNGLGPTIEVGDIIRIHRLTVQNEWDCEVGANTMILSTFAHRNYVLFQQKSNEEYQFYFYTCAKTITLTENDNKRVGELHLFKLVSSKLDKNVASQNKFNETDQDLRLDAPSPSRRDDSRLEPLDNENEFEGIYDSDLASPPVTLTNESVQANQAEESPMPVEDSNNQFAAIINRSDESFVSATDDVIEPDVINFPQGPRSPNTSQLQEEIEYDEDKLVGKPSNRTAQNNSFTLFKNLLQTAEPLNLLCQIITVCGSLDGKEWSLTVRDVEQTVPAEEFKMNQPVFVNQQSCQDCLVINITNARVFEEANILSMLYDAQGSDEVFYIENVKVTGVSPPYGLEVGGDVCQIKKFSYYNELLGSYSERMNDSNVVGAGAADSSRLQVETTRSDGEMNADEDLVEVVSSPTEVERVQQARSTPILPPENNDDDSPVTANEDAEEFAFETARPSPSHSPVNATRKRTHDGTSDEQQWALWTGRLRGKRKPREHYQPEESFQC